MVVNPLASAKAQAALQTRRAAPKLKEPQPASRARSMSRGRSSPKSKSHKYGDDLHVDEFHRDVKEKEGTEDERVGNLHSSRFHLLDKKEQVLQDEEVARIIRQLQSQQRSTQNRRASGSNHRPTSAGRVRAAKSITIQPRMDVHRTHESSAACIEHQKVERDRYQPSLQYDGSSDEDGMPWDHDKKPIKRSYTPGRHTDDDVDEQNRSDEEDVKSVRDSDGRGVPAAVTPLPPTFQDKIMLELQKLKQVQEKDLEIIERLQREKLQAERRAQQLADRLRMSSLSPAANSRDVDKKSTNRSGSARGHKERGQLSPNQTPTPVFTAWSENVDLDGGSNDEPMSPPPPPYDDGGILDVTDGEDEGDGNEHKEDEKVDTRLRGKEKNHTRSLSSSSSSSMVAMKILSSPRFFRKSSRSTERHTQSGRSNEIGRRGRPNSVRARHSRSQYGDSSEEWTSDEGGGQKANERGRSRHRRGSDCNPTSLRERSASREPLRQSCAFFEAKRQAKEQDDQLKRESELRLKRAARAVAPVNLLKRQEQAKQRKSEQLSRIEKEMTVELSPAKRARAREVPATTYAKSNDYIATHDNREQERKERVRQRSEASLAASQLPSRMQLAQQREAKTQAALQAVRMLARTARGSSKEDEVSLPEEVAISTSIKLRKKLRAEAEEEEARRARRPQPVPDFIQLQQRWAKALSVKKSKLSTTEPREFFTSRVAERQRLQEKKLARQQKMQDEADAEKRREDERQRVILERARKETNRQSNSESSRLTKADQLRIRKTQEKLRLAEREREKEQLDAELRALRQKEASKLVTKHVRVSEEKRKGAYAGEFVELQSVDALSKERAKEQRAKFREAVQRNKEKLLVAVAARPTLMERFTTALKREEHKKQALEAVVTKVFRGNTAVMKGILTDEEQELADDLIAADTVDDGGD